MIVKGGMVMSFLYPLKLLKKNKSEVQKTRL